MTIDKDTVAKVAHLARIAEPEARLEPLAKELSTILSWVEQLNEIDTENVPPMTSAVDLHLPFREDVVSDGGYPDKIVGNAPETTDNYFVVPKVVEGG